MERVKEGGGGGEERKEICLGSNGLAPRQKYKDLYGVTEARKDQYLIPKLQ